jgi:hypothetical protein
MNLSLSVSPALNGVALIQQWTGLGDSNLTSNPLSITRMGVNYTFTATMVNFNGSISVQQSNTLYLPPVFNVTFGFANTSASSSVGLTGESVLFKLSALTSGLSISFNVDFGDGTSSIYSLTDKIEIISKSYAFARMYNVSMRTTDQAYQSQVPSANLVINVTGAPSCTPPLLSIENQGSLSNPMQALRSEVIILTSVTILACAFDNTNTKSWSLNEVDPETDTLIGSPIDLTSNPVRFSGSDQAILVVYSNGLNYGRYLAKYRVTVRYTKDGGSTYLTVQSTASTYVQIKPTGLNVFGLPKGILKQTYGTSQQVVLDAGTNTIDLDAFLDTRTLQYLFYCQVIPSGQAMSYFTDPNSIVTRYGSSNFFQVRNTTTAASTPSTECLTSTL